MSAPDNPWDSGGELAPHAGDPGGTWDTGIGDDVVPDVTALVPPDNWANWGPTPDDIDLGIFTPLEWLVRQASAIGIPFGATLHAIACSKGMKIFDFIEVMDTLFKYVQGNDRVDMADPCQILRMAKIGNCVARRYLGISFGPDLQDFWLDGKAANATNLRQESFQFPPDQRGSVTSLSFYPMDTGWFFGRVGAKVEPAIIETQQISLWQGVLERLRAPADVFPKDHGISGKADLSPLREQVPVGTGPSTLHSTGVDWLYPDEIVITFKHSGQNANAGKNEFVDMELFLAGGMTVTSEVEISATAATMNIDGAAVDGWIVTMENWHVRISDRIDFHSSKSQSIPLGPVDLELPDQIFIDLQTQGCPGSPVPVDFDIISDAWHTIPASGLNRQSLFITHETYTADPGNAFGGSPEAFDYFDPLTGAGVTLLDL